MSFPAIIKRMPPSIRQTGVRGLRASTASAAKPSQNEAIFPGVVLSTLLDISLKNTVRGLWPLRQFISSVPTHTKLSKGNRAFSIFLWLESIRRIRKCHLAENLTVLFHGHVEHKVQGKWH